MDTVNTLSISAWALSLDGTAKAPLAAQTGLDDLTGQPGLPGLQGLPGQPDQAPEPAQPGQPHDNNPDEDKKMTDSKAELDEPDDSNKENEDPEGGKVSLPARRPFARRVFRLGNANTGRCGLSQLVDFDLGAPAPDFMHKQAKQKQSALGFQVYQDAF